jgi:hypothetical protein
MLLLLLILVGSLAYAVPRTSALGPTATPAGAESRLRVSPENASRLPSANSRGAKLKLFSAFEGAVPVLLYHRLIARDDGYSVAPAAFAAQMQRLHVLGFEAITLDRYVRFMRGEKVDLPPRPILITFDDAYVSAWQTADPVLARYGWNAAMYVPTGFVGRPGYLTWQQLQQMQASVRWQIDEHAGDGHVLVTIDSAGLQRPSYANELWANGRRESFTHYTRRVSNDIEHGAAMLAHFLPGWSSHGTFAVPYNNYGDNGANDRRIEPWLSAYLKTHFAVTFVQKDDSFTTPELGFANRIAVSSNWNADTLEMHLLSGLKTTNRVSR